MTRCVSFALLSAAFLSAQEFRATLSGRVKDPSGLPVAGARVRAVNTDTRLSHQGATQTAGDYVIPFLPPGPYRFEVEAEGFKKFVREGIVLRVDDRITLDVDLQVGALSESVTVKADAPLLETTTGSAGEVISGEALVDMPLNGRNPLYLVGLAPGVTPTARGTPAFFLRTTSNSSSSSLSIAGSPVGFNEVLLDGVPTTGGNNVVTYIPSTDSTQEFKVQTNAFDAELGRFAGGAINASTKSGSNQLRGSAFNFLRNSALSARDFFAAEVPQFSYNQFGASLGGPVWLPGLYQGRNRTFFFANYEGSREGVARSTVATVPTPLQRSGDFSRTYTRLPSGDYAAITIYDPATTRQEGSIYRRDPFPGNQVPQSRFDPVATKLLNLYPLPNAPADAFTNVNNFRLAFKDPVLDNGYIIKIDHRLSSRHQMFGRVSWRHFYVGRQGEFKSVVSGDAEDRYSPGVALDDTVTLSPSAILNFRYGFARLKSDIRADSLGYDVTQFGFPEYTRHIFVVQAIPAVSISGYTSLSSKNKQNKTAHDTHTVKASLSKHRGRHMLRTGFEGRLLRGYGNSVGADAAGSYSFNANFTRGPNAQVSSLTAGSALASFLLGLGASGSAAMNDSIANQCPYYGLYIQNDIRAASRLSINLGLRNEWEGANTERFNRYNRGFAYQTPNPLDAQARANYAASPIPELPVEQFRAMGGLLFAGRDGQPRGLTNLDRLNLAPRIGAAYSLAKKTVIRGGWGIFYGPTTSLATTSVGFGISTPWVATRDNGLRVVNPLSDPFPDGLLKAPGADGGLLTFVGQGISFVDVNRKLLYLHQFQISLQREAPGRVLVEAAYSGSRSRDLPQSREINPTPEPFRAEARQVFVATGRNILNDSVPNPFYGLITSGSLSGRTTTRGQLLKPFPHYTSINRRNSNIGSAGYNSLQIKVSKRLSHGLTLLAGYTNGKLIRKMSILNATQPEPSKELAEWDVPQRLTFSASYDLPFARRRRFIGGWKLNALYTANSGIPLSVSGAESLGRSARLPTSQRTLDRWFDTSAFRQRETLELVATSRLPDVRSHGRNNFDLSALKTFTLHEKLKAQFRAEAFNAFNRTEFDTPGSSLGANFGVVRSQNNFARQVQLALKLLW